MIELKESKESEEDGEQIVSFQNKNANEIFDLSFANNYLILISFAKNISIDQVNSDDYKSDFAIVGYLSNQEKNNVVETPKALVMVNYAKLRKYLKKEWTVCYVRPIEKITTFLR